MLTARPSAGRALCRTSAGPGERGAGRRRGDERVPDDHVPATPGAWRRRDRRYGSAHAIERGERARGPAAQTGRPRRRAPSRPGYGRAIGGIPATIILATITENPGLLGQGLPIPPGHHHR